MRNVSAILVLVVAACGGGEPADTTAAETDQQAPTTASASTQGTQPPTTEAEEPAEPAAPEVPGGIVLTIGGETWEFEGALCAYLNAPAGQEGSEWNVSNTKDGLQVYVNDDSFGQFVSIADIQNGGSPTLSWEAEGDAVSIAVDGNDITAEGTFTDGVGGTGPTDGTLHATCASWAAG